MLKLHWLENISFFPGSQSERGKQNSTHKTPHVCSFSKEQVPAGVVAPEIPYPGTSSDPKEVCADSSESLTANKKNYPYFLLCFAPLQTKQNISFPTWVKRSSHSNSFELLVSSASSSQRPQLHSPGSRRGQQDRRTEGQQAHISPWEQQLRCATPVPSQCRWLYWLTEAFPAKTDANSYREINALQWEMVLLP